jgi:hypothetical protein
VTFSAYYAAAFARTAPVSACCEAVFARTASAVAGYNAARAHTTSVGACCGPVYVLSASLCSCCEDTAGTSLQLLVRLGGRNCTILAVCTLHNFPRTPRARRETDTHLETWNFVLFCFYVVFPFSQFPDPSHLLWCIAKTTSEAQKRSQIDSPPRTHPLVYSLSVPHFRMTSIADQVVV